jgi:uncharacterized membrane protein
MWRHTWFKILVGLQLVNFAAMVLLEQQRRTIWDKEATNAQKILDMKQFTEKTETDVRYVARQLEDLRGRMAIIQGEAERNSATAALLTDVRDRVQDIEASVQRNSATAALLTDVRDRVQNIEASVHMLKPQKP